MSREPEERAGGYYRCKWCGQVLWRDSAKAWIRSMCDSSGYRTVHLVRVARPEGNRP